jgi:uncharacterized protein YegL
MKNAIDIVLLLDRSGSMYSIRDDTIGGYNRFVRDQKEVPGEATFTLIQFDAYNPHELIHDGIDLRDVPEMTHAGFVPRGGTPLYDAMGATIASVGERLSALPEDLRPNKVVFVTITDGKENSSREYTKERVASMIKEQSEKYSWQFVFLGADVTAMQQGADFGISTDRVAHFDAARIGDAYNTTSSLLSSFRSTGDPSSLCYTTADRSAMRQKS